MIFLLKLTYNFNTIFKSVNFLGYRSPFCFNRGGRNLFYNNKQNRQGFLPGGKFNYAKRFFMKLNILVKKQMISEKKFV